MSLVYLFLCLCGLALACTTVALLAFSILAWVKKWKILKWISSVATLIVASAFMLLNYGLTTEGDYPRLREPPVEERIPGTYALDGNSTTDLRAKGYTNLSVQVTLNRDRTFEIRDMPHLWLYGSSYRAGYDTCYGTWTVETTTGGSAYYLAAWLKRFDARSAYQTDPEKRLDWVPLNLIAQTSKRPDYALALPLNCGDEGYIYFRKLNADETVQRTGASGSRHDTNRASSAAGPGR